MIKVIRSVCLFSKNPCLQDENRLLTIENLLKDKGYSVQTKRICSPVGSFSEMSNSISDKSIMLSLGSLDFDSADKKLEDFLRVGNIHFNLDLSNEKIDLKHVEILFKIIKENPPSTFSFTYSFNNPVSSPYFPSAKFEKEGFSIGLQVTDLAKDCNSLEEWFENMRFCWNEINSIFESRDDFLGIDSSVAPLFEKDSSLIYFIKRIFDSFNYSVLTDTYLRITEFIKKENPRPVGLCGLMFPCLEDFELANEYSSGNFSVERNIFLSLHSGLGIDTYPIGVDEDKDRVVNILEVVQGLSRKYSKPLSVRFVSDGKAKVGEKTDFQNQYLKDVVVRKL